MIKRKVKHERIYIARDKRMDEIGIPINPHPYAPETRSQSLIRNFGNPYMLSFLVVLLVAVIYFIVKLLTA